MNQQTTLESTCNEPASSFFRERGWKALIVLFLGAVCLLANNEADPDLWGHVQFGRDVIRDGIIHPTTTYSFTANGFRWINHENISELVLATTYDNFGIAGLIAGKLCLAVLLLLGMVWCARRNQASNFVIGLILFLIAARLSFHWHFRPQIASFVLCAMMLVILEWCFRGWTENLSSIDETSIGQIHRRLKWLWVMPLVLCVWANSHGGFVAGVCIYVAYLGGRAIEAFLYQRQYRWGLIRRLILMGTVGVLGTLVNPYGPDLHLWLLQSLGEPRPEIRDWHPVELTSSHGTQFLILVGLGLLSVAGTDRKRDWTRIVILALVCWQAYSHIRHMAFFVLLFGFWMPGYVQGLMDHLQTKLGRSTTKEFKTETRWSPAFIAVVVLLVGLCGYRCSDLHVDKSEFPVAAFEYMADQEVSGKLVVTYNWAQYAIGAFGGEHRNLPVCPVAFDGRFRTCYPQEIVDMHFDFVIGDQGPGTRNRGESSGKPDDTKVLEFGKPELVLISRRQVPSVDVMQSQKETWCLLYQDQLAQVWGRKSVFDSPESQKFLPPSQRKISNELQQGVATWPAIPNPHASEPGSLIRNALSQTPVLKNR